MDNAIWALLSCDLFQKISTGKCSLVAFNTIELMLMKNNIPFSTAFSPSTRKNAPGLQLTIYVSPALSLVYNISLTQGTSILENEI